MSEELDRRGMLEAALEQAEEGTLEAPIEKEIEVCLLYTSPSPRD